MTNALRFVATAALACILSAAPALAKEAYLGASFHGVDTPFTLEAGERGQDLQLGFRTDPVGALAPIGKPSVYLHGQASLDGQTSLIAAGLSWKLGSKVYVRPGIGLALHNDRITESGPDGLRIDLGSRVLFEPEIALGLQLNKRVAAELSWVHVSHATLLSPQNPGMDFIGARVVVTFD